MNLFYESMRMQSMNFSFYFLNENACINKTLFFFYANKDVKLEEMHKCNYMYRKYFWECAWRCL